MRRAHQDITIERNVYPDDKIHIRLAGNLITNEIYHMAQVVWLHQDSQGNTYATNYQPYNPSGILFNKQWDDESYVFRPYKFRDSYYRPCHKVIEKWDKEKQKNLKAFCKTFKKFFLTFLTTLKK